MATSVGTIPIAKLPATRDGGTVSFRIPDYQRGYRWTANDVTRLLDDLDKFIGEGDDGRPFYCLQPLVVKRDDADGGWEVVDGQQRLTTLFLLWRFLNRSSPYRLSYDTRSRSAEFLENVSAKARSDVTNIDFHHIYYAHQAIWEFFRDDESKKTAFRRLLSDTDLDGRNVRFIWYELGDEDAVAAFTRLNVGKIPLTDEELIRALFLRNPSGGPLAISAFQHRLALEWDRIETALQAPDFWGFLSGQSPPEGSRIRLLLELCAPEETATTDRGIFQHFEAKLKKAGPEELQKEWQEIVSRFELLQEWHDDLVTFHLVGFIATILNDTSKSPLRRLLEAAAVKTKSSFVAGLRSEIRSNLMGGKNVSEFVASLDYIDNAEPIRPTLVLFNIAALLRCNGIETRFPFHLYHDPNNGWDLEHVQSQAGDGLGDEKSRREWLEACAVALREESGPERDKRLAQIETFREKGQNFDILEKSIRQYFDESDSSGDLHGIGNLTLLDRSTNRAYGNAPFVVKRAEILKAERGGRFLLPCTRDLFLKVFSKNPGNLRRWNLEEDGAAHEKAICQALETFFDGKGGSS